VSNTQDEARAFWGGLGECGPCAHGSQMFGALNERRPQTHTLSIPLSRSRASCPMTANVLSAYVGRTPNSCDVAGRARPVASDRRGVVVRQTCCDVAGRARPVALHHTMLRARSSNLLGRTATLLQPAQCVECFQNLSKKIFYRLTNVVPRSCWAGLGKLPGLCPCKLGLCIATRAEPGTRKLRAKN